MDSARGRGGGCWLRRVPLDRTRSEFRSRCEGSLGAERSDCVRGRRGPAPCGGRQRSGREAGSRPPGPSRFDGAVPHGPHQLRNRAKEGATFSAWRLSKPPWRVPRGDPYRVDPPLSRLRSTAEIITEFSESLCSMDRGGTSRNALDLSFSVQRLSENSVTRSLGGCHSPRNVPLTPKPLFPRALARSHRRDHPKRS